MTKKKNGKTTSHLRILEAADSPAPQSTTSTQTGAAMDADMAEEMVHQVFSGKIVGGSISQMATYSDLFLRMPEPIFLLAPNDFRVIEANPAGLEVLHLTQKQLLGHPLSDWAMPNAKKHAEEVLQQGYQATIPFQAGTGKEVLLELLPCPVSLGDYGSAIQVIARNVTQAHRYRQRLEEINAALERLSSTDEMTGLLNFRSIKENLRRTHESALDSGSGYSVIFIDVDHFKKYNDRNGHPAGDDVLRKVAQVLTQSARPGDFPARYGGEEFLVLCPNTSPLQALSLAEIIREAIAQTKIPYGEHQPLGQVTASIGVAGFPDNGTRPQEVLENADQALYHSKHSGRNRVTLFGTPIVLMNPDELAPLTTDVTTDAEPEAEKTPGQTPGRAKKVA